MGTACTRIDDGLSAHGAETCVRVIPGPAAVQAFDQTAVPVHSAGIVFVRRFAVRYRLITGGGSAGVRTQAIIHTAYPEKRPGSAVGTVQDARGTQVTGLKIQASQTG